MEGMPVEDVKCAQNFCQNLKGRDSFGDLGIDESIILKDIKETGCEGVKWIQEAEDKV
jgi:hypothetical protein